MSDDWNRCCCTPYHPLKLEVRQYVPVPGDANASDFSHLTSDVINDFSRFTGGVDRQQALRNYYLSQPPLLSIVRNDGMRFCCKTPCKVLNCCVCLPVCQDGMTAYAGPVQDELKEDGKPKEAGRPYNLDRSKAIASVIQPQFAGWFMPTVHLRTEDLSEESSPFAKVQGPFCFGGCSEFCCDFNFPISYYTSAEKTGDVGKIVKLKPSNLGMAITELISDSDFFSIQFNENAKLDVSQKIAVITAQLLLDYMLFDGNTEKIKDDSDGTTIYCCYMSCIGCLIPCSFTIPKNNGGD